MEEDSNKRAVSKRLWTKQEDQLLCTIVAKYNDVRWAVVSQQFNNGVISQVGKSRTNKQCRQRWQNHLNPILQNNTQWSMQQHSMLFTLFRQYSHQWCVISSKLQLNGFARRGDNHIKNYFYSSIKRAIKTINSIIRQNNKTIKKHKSQIYNYQQKYAYKKRLSLQRQIMNHSHNDSTSHEQHQPHEPNKDLSLPDMRILKELDQDIVSKILLIAEQKGSNKFAASNKHFKEEAVTTRNTLIDYIQDHSGFQPQDVIQLTIKILQISRKCKRKTNKGNSSEVSEVEAEAQKEEKRQEIDRDSVTIKEQQNKQLQQKPLISQFLCEESESNQQDNKKGFSWSNSSPKLQDQHQNSIFSLFPPTQQLPRIGLDMSNSYLFASNSYSIQNNISYAYNMVNYPVNQYAGYNVDPNQNNPGFASPNTDLFQQKAKSKDGGNEQMGLGLNFLSTIKQIQPKQSIINAQMFDFDLNPNATNIMNPFAHNLFRNDSQQDRLFCSQVVSLQKPSSHRSNKSKQKSELNDYGVEGLMRSQQLMNRSWAYSSGRLQQCINLFNSNNYESSRKNDFGVDLHNRNFYPFSPKQQ